MLVKHSSLLRRQCEQEAGSLLAPWRVVLKRFIGVEEVKKKKYFGKLWFLK